ncbi:recombination protein RecR [Campylobacter fetus]|uniref:Recombination protein RecR n=3 Tax=Campylobacter fetus TaxID=196 RepID=A0A5L4IC55_CAMFE|nr:MULTISPECIES: recombination mediator RecR [Campylobacter]OCS22854.1 recombination protein RecR [Campylobacter fetus subsp. venerealis cfvi97/532]OCS26210.1 recombination protein RecR [Campylobacter fetus subsp. venerealis cfvB10]OCS29693.1 recombination protein RecR [Campylobacter fetus subsp. venerealis LMG 6570 = CCUG 33900]OCS43147.1 recombination protein RecR [Campylobacter fetus subsp. venerealis cfvi02/298]ABK83264.1 recombination protein RecR [Campylobacter fetus subsp. fetus 82-40]
MPNQKLEKFNELVSCFEKIPGVGKKSALKYAYHVALQDSFFGLNLAHTIEDAVRFLKHCSMCGGISENEICDICSDINRDKKTLCIVETPKDILTIEYSNSFNGLYFVFDDANKLDKLKSNIKENGIKELLFALTPSINSDGMMLYIEDKLKDFDVSFTKIAQGIPTGVSLENVDILSLTKAIKDRRSL